MARANRPRRAVDGPTQFLHATSLTAGEYLTRQEWWKATPPPCPYHEQGGCELRPVWQRTEERVRAHVLVASLALALDRVLERKLRKAGLQLSTRAAWEALERVNLVEFEMKGKAPKRGVCVNSEEARKVLRALGVKPQAPQPPAEGELTVH